MAHPARLGQHPPALRGRRAGLAVLGFWPSDAVLVATQASLVCGPRPTLPRVLDRFRSGAWAWLLLPASLGGTIALLALVPGLGAVYAWVAALGVPAMAALAIAPALRRVHPLGLRVALVVAVTGILLALAWRAPGLAGQAAAVSLTALSCCAVAAYLAALAPSIVLRAALVAMAVLDSVLVFGQLLQGPNDTLNAAGVGHHLPHLQVAVFGSVLMGYGDFFVAAVLGNVLTTAAVPPWPRRWVGAVLVLGCSALFDLLFLVVDTLPATVPIAVALLIIEAGRWRRSRRAP